MKPPDPKPDASADRKPTRDLTKPHRPKSLLQWLLERLCMYPAGD